MKSLARYAIIFSTLVAIISVGNTASAQMSQADKEIAAGILNIIGGVVNQPPKKYEAAPTYSPNATGHHNHDKFYRPPQHYPQPQHYPPHYPPQYRPQYRPQYPSQPTYPSYPSSDSIYYSPSTSGSTIYSPSYSSSSSSSTYKSSSSSSSAPSISEYKKSKPSFIICPDDQDGIFDYELVSNKTGKVYEYSISAGERQEIKEPSRWKIRFRPGSGSARKTYEIDPDTTYQALQMDDKWGVYAE